MADLSGLVAQILEAMEEVGFVRVKAHVVPRNMSDTLSSGSRSRSSSMSSVSDQADPSGDDGLMHMSDLMRRTEREEGARNNYTVVSNGGKVFATGSFSSEFALRRSSRMACADVSSLDCLHPHQRTSSLVHLSIWLGRLKHLNQVTLGTVTCFEVRIQRPKRVKLRHCMT